MGFIVSSHYCSEDEKTVCPLRLVNGSVLVVIATIGLLLNSLELYFLIFRIRLPANQNVFLINVAVSDVAMSLSGIVRGAGMICTLFIGLNPSTHHVSWFCPVFEILVQMVSNSGVIVLLPLTLDRYIAVVFPIRHRCIMSKRVSVGMTLCSWVPILCILTKDLVSYNLTNTLKIEYDPNYLRCVRIGSFVVQSITIILPFALIMVMYLLIILEISRSSLHSRRILTTSSLVIFSGIIAYFPSCISNIFNITISYEFAQIATVTFYYTSCVVNPLVYFCMHPRAKIALSVWLRELSTHRQTRETEQRNCQVSVTNGTNI